MSDFDLTAAGFFASDDCVPCEVKLGGETGTVYVKKLSAMDMRRWGEEMRDDDREVRINAGFRVLAKAIRREDGKAYFTEAQAQKLKLEAVQELTRVFVEVNKLPDAEEAGNG
jgi:hypothetical protein